MAEVMGDIADHLITLFGGPATLFGGPAQVYTAHRINDVTGISGTGDVATVTVCGSGFVVCRWRDIDGIPGSAGVYASLDAWVAVHGHNGATRLVEVQP